MCIIAFAYKTPGMGQLVLLANRDEYYARPAEHGFARDGKKMGVPCVYSTEQLVYPQAWACG
ncbi:NRDE family protein [Chromobacterium phragmitis]|uniref:NRDE family protein n=1 Tax=Chromobacterium phragmitis TaxID=2202141 RepID=UPI0032676493